MLKRWLQTIRTCARQSTMIRWQGDYASWREARLACGEGYSEQQIIDTVVAATRKVVSGQAAYERDSVTFDHIEYSWPLATAITWAAARAQGQLRVVDFGGALGSSYRQNRVFLDGLATVRWVVVEQPAFVRIGQEEFTTDQLLFAESLEQAIALHHPNLLIAPSVLQYLQDPYRWLEIIAASNADIVVFDRTLLSLEARDRLTVQTVPPSIYPARYPCWMINEEKLLATMAQAYELVERFSGNFNNTIAIDGQPVACEAGFIFRKRT